MSRDDLYALWSYLRLVPAVSHQHRRTRCRFRSRCALGSGSGRASITSPAAFSPQPAKGEAWNRGYYLVEALGHCDTCHAARSGAPSEAPGHRLTEVQIEDWYVPDMAGGALTSITGKLAVHDSLSHLTEADALAVETYLKDRQKGVAGEHTQPITTTSDENLKEGQALFERSCASCHGSSGQGRKGVAALAGARRSRPAHPTMRSSCTARGPARPRPRGRHAGVRQVAG